MTPEPAEDPHPSSAAARSGSSPEAAHAAVVEQAYFQHARDTFVSALQQGKSPRIEDYINGSLQASKHPALLQLLLTVELEFLRRSGESPVADAYLARFPSAHSAVLAAFCTSSGDERSQLGATLGERTIPAAVMDQDTEEALLGSGPLRKGLAVAVHLFTATGAVCGVLAIEAIYIQAWTIALLWMVVAVVIDAVDGTFARMVQVRRVLPAVDGELLDNIVDYFNYVVVPALFIYQFIDLQGHGLLPAGWELAATAMICLSSAFQFSQIDAKTADHYFKGFPSYWNITALYLAVLGLGPWLNLALIVLLCVLVFVPIKYIYPTRTPRFKRRTLVLTLLWGGTMVALLAQFPQPRPWLVWLSLVYVAYYTWASMHLMWERRRARG